MTYTEKILNLLELNEEIPAIVTEEDGTIVTSNREFYESFGNHVSGNNFIKFFDSNTSLLIKNSMLDAKTFYKVERRNIEVKLNDENKTFRLIISPFKLDDKLYFYNLLLDIESKIELILYPYLKESAISKKYEDVISKVSYYIPNRSEDVNEFQLAIDGNKDLIAIFNRSNILFANKNFIEKSKKNYEELRLIGIKKVFSTLLLSKIELAKNEIYNNNIPFILEKLSFSELKESLLLYPLEKEDDIVENILIMGNFDLFNSVDSEKKEFNTNMENSIKTISYAVKVDKKEKAKLIYDSNTLDILDANQSAANIYEYDLNELKHMNVTQLFKPEEMQKLIIPFEENNKYIFNQLKKDGSAIEVNITREKTVYNGKDAYKETIEINKVDEEIIELEEFEDKKTVLSKPVSENKPQPKQLKEKEHNSEFLSSLFHELLTPVNVILGFVQEIIDGVDNPTEEQEESAKIIKDNQHILLQAMNTAVQYAQLEENKLKLKYDEFIINNYLVDLQDSFSRVSQKRNVSVIYDEIPESIRIKNDRPKYLAALSYFVNFAIKLTEFSKIYISFKVIDDKFFVLIKDNYPGIDKKLSSNLLELYSSSSLNDINKTKNLSPIAVKLAKKLNNLLSISVEEFVHDNKESIAFVAPVNFSGEFEKINETAKVQEEIIDKVETETDIQELTIEKTVQAEEKKEDVIEYGEVEKNIDEMDLENLEEEFEKEQIEQKFESQIHNGLVDNKIVEDIEEEKEIITEEIATVEVDKVELTFNISDYSCLFIDDSIDSQLLFKSQMSDLKLLKISTNLTEALPLLDKYNFDLVLVDINLNDKYNGFDTLKIIRQFEHYKNIPIIAVTAYPFEGDREKFLDFGFTEYIVKPLLKEQLINTFEKVLS
jgi:CheY-like chemotaxis protein